MIDTHAHLYAEELDDDRPAMMQRAKEAGISKIVLPNVDSSTLQRMLDLESDYPGYCFSAIGVHPTSIGENWKEELAMVERELNRRNTPDGLCPAAEGLPGKAAETGIAEKTELRPAPEALSLALANRHPATPENRSTPYIAIGEIGTDLYWDKTYLLEQQEAFARQLQLSIDYQLPVIIHVRDSFDETFEVMQDFKGKGLRGIFHSFTGSADQATTISELGTFYLGINGIISFKNSGLKDVVRNISPERMVLETDSPYLSPVPYRGKLNESSRLPLIAMQLAQLYAVSLEEIVEITTKNAQSLFNFQQKS